jgi:hypothetical protein
VTASMPQCLNASMTRGPARARRAVQMLIAAALAVFAASCDYGNSPNTATRTTNHPTRAASEAVGPRYDSVHVYVH